jgi:hypothetical protein
MSFQQEEPRTPTRIGRLRLILEDNGEVALPPDGLGNVPPRYQRYIEFEILDQYGVRIGGPRTIDLDAFITAQRRTSLQGLQDEIRTKGQQQIIKVPTA